MGKAEVSPSLARLAVGALNRPYVGHILDLPKKGGDQCRLSQRLNVRPRGDRRRRGVRHAARRLLRHLLRPPRHACARRRRCGGRQPGHADDRSVAAHSGNTNIAFNGERMRGRSSATAPTRSSTPVRPRHRIDFLPVRRAGSSRRPNAPAKCSSGVAQPAAVTSQWADRQVGNADQPVMALNCSKSLSDAYRTIHIPTTKTRVVVLTADAGIRGTVRATFGASAQIELHDRPGHAVASGSRIRCSTARPSSSSTSMPASADEMQALERLMLRVGNWPAGRRGHARAFDANVARTLAADAGRRFPGQAGAAGRAGAHLRARRQGAEPRRDHRGADLHLPARGRRRRRHHARGPDRDAAAQQRRSAASPRPAWSISISSTAPAPTISTSSRASTSTRSSRGRSGSTGSCSKSCCRTILGPRGDRRAEPAGRDALVRSRHGDAAARSGVVAFRLRRDRHAAHLVLLDRQRAARLQQAVHRQRDDGAGPAPRQAAGRGDPRAARRRAAAAGHRQPLRAADVRIRPAQADIEQALGDAFAGMHPEQLRLVREAIDRGVPLDEVKPGNKITAQLKKLILPQAAAQGAPRSRAGARQEAQARRWRDRG